MALDFNKLINTGFVRSVIQQVCGENTEVIKRPAAFFIRNKEENEALVKRVIVLPPNGYTANALNQTNSHDEALRATIEIKGGVREGKQGFSKLKNCLLVAAFNNKSGISGLNVPYLTFDLKSTPNLSKDFHSAGTPPFMVVKENGYGFYHNLINVSEDWLVLLLHKTLRPQKRADISDVLQTLPVYPASTLDDLYQRIVEHGDELFSKAPALVNKVLALPPEHSLPALGEMLYTYDTGRHEACTAFAMLLKVGKTYPERFKEFIEGALEKKVIPSYYGEQLLGKINWWDNPDNLEESLKF